MIARAEQLWQAAQNYASFDDASNAGIEGRIIGFKHSSSNKLGEAIILTRKEIYFIVRNDGLDDGSWRSRRLI